MHAYEPVSAVLFVPPQPGQPKRPYIAVDFLGGGARLLGPYVGRNIFILSTTDASQIQSSTQAPILQRGGRAARGLALGLSNKLEAREQLELDSS